MYSYVSPLIFKCTFSVVIYLPVIYPPTRFSTMHAACCSGCLPLGILTIKTINTLQLTKQRFGWDIHLLFQLRFKYISAIYLQTHVFTLSGHLRISWAKDRHMCESHCKLYNFPCDCIACCFSCYTLPFSLTFNLHVVRASVHAGDPAELRDSGHVSSLRGHRLWLREVQDSWGKNLFYFLKVTVCPQYLRLDSWDMNCWHLLFALRFAPAFLISFFYFQK